MINLIYYILEQILNVNYRAEIIFYLKINVRNQFSSDKYDHVFMLSYSFSGDIETILETHFCQRQKK